VVHFGEKVQSTKGTLPEYLKKDKGENKNTLEEEEIIGWVRKLKTFPGGGAG